jgi:hypothetical protein
MKFYDAAFFIAGVDNYDLITDGVNLGHTDPTEAVDIISELFLGRKRELGFLSWRNGCRLYRVLGVGIVGKYRQQKLRRRRKL